MLCVFVKRSQTCPTWVLITAPDRGQVVFSVSFDWLIRVSSGVLPASYASSSEGEGQTQDLLPVLTTAASRRRTGV